MKTQIKTQIKTRKHNERHGDEIAVYQACKPNYPTVPNYFDVEIPFYLSDIGRERTVDTTWHVFLCAGGGRSFINKRERAFPFKEEAIEYALELAHSTGLEPVEWIF